MVKAHGEIQVGHKKGGFIHLRRRLRWTRTRLTITHCDCLGPPKGGHYVLIYSIVPPPPSASSGSMRYSISRSSSISSSVGCGGAGGGGGSSAGIRTPR